MGDDSGVVGLPSGVKSAGQRVDFKTDKFVLAIETKGYRLAWSRAMLCPCKPINDQTDQPDPNCSLCSGSGWVYFAPGDAVTSDRQIGELDSVQRSLLTDAGCIYGVLTGITGKDEVYGELGKRLMGQMMLTVRAENKLGYHDRIVNLDSLIVFSQVLDPVDDVTTPLSVRYPIHQVNALRAGTKTLTEPDDFTVVDGAIVWDSGSTNLPAVGLDPIGIHYLCHPTWLVVEHPHSVRMTPVLKKLKNPPTPAGLHTDLPLQAIVQYEFLPG